MKIPSLSRHRETPAARDVDGDGRVDSIDGDGRVDGYDRTDGFDDVDRTGRVTADGDGRHSAPDARTATATAPVSPPVGGAPAVAERTDEQTTYRSAAARGAGGDQRTSRERRAAERAATARAATARSSRTDTGSFPTVTDRSATDPTAADRAETNRTAAGRADAVDRADTNRTAVGTADPNRTATSRVTSADRTDRAEDATAVRPVAVTRDGEQTADNRAARRTASGAALGSAAVAERTDPDADAVEREPDVVVERGPRPRTSLLATLSLIFGVASVLFVLTGTLAGYGMVLGGIGALLGVAGLSATRRRHVAGTTEAMLGMIFSLGAVVLGILAMTGQFGWPSTAGDWVQRFREWLDAQFADRF